MYLHALATAIPPAAFSQQDCWQLLEQSGRLQSLLPRSRAVLRKVLSPASAIESRHFAVTPLSAIFDLSASALNQAYEQAAPKLAAAALVKAMAKAACSAADIDALFVCSCTGYLCPGLSSYVAELIGLPGDRQLRDLVGHGCAAALPMLESASHFLHAKPNAKVACVAVEICSAAFYLDDDPGVLISLCLFGDGAAATICSADADGAIGRFEAFQSLHLPHWREGLRFVNRDGKLCNQLSPEVPAQAAEAVARLHRAAVQQLAMPVDFQPITHTGGREVLRALEGVLPNSDLQPSWNTLRRYGNQSSPSVLFSLQDALQSNPQSPPAYWLATFGAGFSAHACRFTQRA